MEMERIECSPLQIVAEVTSITRVAAIEKGLELTVRYPETVPKTIRSDPLRIRQALTNLVANAIKFTEEGWVRIEVSLAGSNGAPLLQFAVTDSGIGIDEAKLSTIFDPFCQADRSTTRQFGGTGLGLTISKRIALALGGDLTGSSELGTGSTFEMSIDPGPLGGVEMLENPAEAGEFLCGEEEQVLSPGRLTGKILLVEDTLVNQHLIRIVLENLGLEVRTADNGQIALDKAQEERFDLILMDIRMPVMDGLTATRELRSRGLETPIIALTARALDGANANCIAAGCNGYLTKPIETAAIAKELSKHLGNGSAAPSQPKSGSQGATQYIDIEKSMQRMELDRSTFLSILDESISFLHETLSKLEVAVQSADGSAISYLAHAIASNAGNVGMDHVLTLGRSLENVAEEYTEGDLQQVFRGLQQELVAALQEAKTLV